MSLREVRNLKPESLATLRTTHIGTPMPVRFMFCDFSGLDLSEFDFELCEFHNCKLIRTTIRKAKKAKFFTCEMTDAVLANADIRWVFFSNCETSRMDITGAQTTVNCNFYSGMKAHNTDAYKLLYLISAMDAPIMQEVRKLIPEAARLILDCQFERDPQF